MPDIEISLNCVLKLLNNLKPGKAAGQDCIQPILQTELRVELSPIIKVIFERSLETSKLPVNWFRANITPIFLKGDKSLAASYRPISLTCICARSSSTYWLLTLQDIWTSRPSCMTFSTAFERNGHAMLIEDLAREQVWECRQT